MKTKNLDEFEYLIQKTLVYLEFHNDDTAKDLGKQWHQVWRQLQQLKKAKESTETMPTNYPKKN